MIQVILSFAWVAGRLGDRDQGDITGFTPDGPTVSSQAFPLSPPMSHFKSPFVLPYVFPLHLVIPSTPPCTHAYAYHDPHKPLSKA